MSDHLSHSRLQWRWSGQPIKIGPCYAQIVWFIPLLVITGLSFWTFAVAAIYGAWLMACSAKGFTPRQMLVHLHVKYVDRGRWPAF